MNCHNCAAPLTPGQHAAVQRVGHLTKHWHSYCDACLKDGAWGSVHGGLDADQLAAAYPGIQAAGEPERPPFEFVLPRLPFEAQR